MRKDKMRISNLSLAILLSVSTSITIAGMGSTNIASTGGGGGGGGQNGGGGGGGQNGGGGGGGQNGGGGGGGFNVPTGGQPSPLFGAQPFTQQILRFEEFGTNVLPASTSPGVSFPRPPTEFDSPDGDELDAFLAQDIYPLPSRLANDADENPWKLDIETFLGRILNTPPAEGRPPGEGWAHQRWEDLGPEIYYKTAQAGARTNSGLRDGMQDHGYSAGEFGPGGLYYNTAGAPGFDGTTAGLDIRLHPLMPIQDPEALWTFDGTLPPKLLKAKYGKPILTRHYNALPIDPSANFGFGLHTLSTHEHNGHNPAESDGYTGSFFFPGQYYDYRWPMILAGSDTINANATDSRAGTPDGNGGIEKIPGDYRETMSTHWFHDHMLDFTAQNVYKGNAAMMNYYSALDRGNEAINDGVNLRLPSGSALDWGNRDYDVNILMADKAWDANGQLWFNIFNLDGFLGDQMTVNWLYKPYMDVRARRYRLRMLNGAVSRYMKVAFVDQNNNPVPVYMVANDGNIMEHTVLFANGVLPNQSIAERYDVIIDFSNYAPGTKIYMVNIMEHRNGRRPNRVASLASVLADTYSGDPAVGKFLEFRVAAYTGTDLSMNPADFVAGQQVLLEQPGFSDAELAGATRHTFRFGRGGGGTDRVPWTIATDGGQGVGMDVRRISAAPNLGDLSADGLGHVEIWSLSGGTGGWSHPVHIHFEEGKILSKDGRAPPDYEAFARKDVYRLGVVDGSARRMDIALRFREFAGSYMEHCHNTTHEDHAMLLRFDIENPGQFVALPAPLPTWDGVTFIDSFLAPNARTGNGGMGGGGGGGGGGMGM
ncbi:Glycoprotein gp2 [hydrothermal vent metagenome]|uniref:Glycoprotein gp2 n=1 Tax=hydrothermal vent metagenome TaxID=652676 RepID=A0A3B0W576_9ZZZZ